MTKEELQIIRLSAQLVALETLFIATSRALQRGFPAYAQSLREIGRQRTDEYRQGIAFRDLSPEKSDLVAAELQEAFEDLLERALLKEGE